MKKVFIDHPEIKSRDIDNLGHVNNEVDLRWLIEAAVEHNCICKIKGASS